MYNPASFREREPARLFEFVETYPFGMLVAEGGAHGVELAHVPFVLDRGEGTPARLRLHVARANPIWRAALAAGRVRARPGASGRVRAVFSGPDAYVSASWYEKPHEEVPTWNYAVVHVRGRVSGPMTKTELRTLLADLAAIHERGSAPAWSLGLLEPRFLDELLDEIVGLSIDVTHLEGKFKLSQNRSDADRLRVKAALALRGGGGDTGIAALMA